MQVSNDRPDFSRLLKAVAGGWPQWRAVEVAAIVVWAVVDTCGSGVRSPTTESSTPEETRADRRPIRPETVTHVSGMNCYLCPKNGPEKIGRDDWIRTSDPLTPSQVRYQAAPHPDSIRALDRWSC